MVKHILLNTKLNEWDYNHSDYNYQKYLEPIYGYTQNVTKGNGKVYIYHRPGYYLKHHILKR